MHRAKTSWEEVKPTRVKVVQVEVTLTSTLKMPLINLVVNKEEVDSEVIPVHRAINKITIKY